MSELKESTKARMANPVNRQSTKVDTYKVNKDSAKGTEGSGAMGRTKHSSGAPDVRGK